MFSDAGDQGRSHLIVTVLIGFSVWHTIDAYAYALSVSTEQLLVDLVQFRGEVAFDEAAAGSAVGAEGPVSYLCVLCAKNPLDNTRLSTKILVITRCTYVSKDYAMKQISIQIVDETARQIAWLAKYWGYPEKRHNTAVIERAINTIYMLEVGTEEYRRRLEEMGATTPPSKY